MAGRCRRSAISQVSISETTRPPGGVGVTGLSNISFSQTLTTLSTPVVQRLDFREAPGYQAPFERIAPAGRESCDADAAPSDRHGSGAVAHPASRSLQRAAMPVQAGRSTASR